MNNDGYYSACNCDRRGSFTRTCRRYDGQCPCLRNYGGRQCNQCRVGYFDFPSCRSCNCVPAGILLTPEAPTGCYQYDPVSAHCVKSAYIQSFSGLYIAKFGVNTEISVYSQNMGKYGQEKLQTRTLFTQ